MTKKFSPPPAEEISLTAAKAFAKILAEVIDLLKKFFAAVIFVLAFSSQASAMHLTINESVGSIGQSGDFTLKIDGGKQIEGDDSKGAVLFGNLYFHFDARLLKEKMPQAKSYDDEQKIFDRASRFGGADVENCVPVFVFEGRTKIIPISGDDGRDFYLLATETGGGGSMKVIGERDGVWVQYFDTYDAKRQLGYEFYMKDFYAAGDTLVFVYEEWNTKATRELHYQWDAAAQWFGVELK